MYNIFQIDSQFSQLTFREIFTHKLSWEYRRGLNNSPGTLCVTSKISSNLKEGSTKTSSATYTLTEFRWQASPFLGPFERAPSASLPVRALAGKLPF